MVSYKLSIDLGQHIDLRSKMLAHDGGISISFNVTHRSVWGIIKYTQCIIPMHRHSEYIELIIIAHDKHAYNISCMIIVDAEPKFIALINTSY